MANRATRVDLRANPSSKSNAEVWGRQVFFKNLSNSTQEKRRSATIEGIPLTAASFYQAGKFGSSKPIERLWFPGGQNNVNTVIAISGRVRASDERISSTGAGPIFYTGGIDIESYPDGDDLIYPNGRGYIDAFSMYKYKVTVVDDGWTFVNPRNGKDVAVGGFGRDYIGSRSSEVLVNLAKARNDKGVSNASGSKLYVGGSWDDVLDGGADADFLVGDRFNEYELYLPSAALNKNPLGSSFTTHINNINLYQPYRFSAADAQGNQRLGQTKETGKIAGSYYPLWSPGGDAIRSYAGDDTIYGDDNAENNLALLANYKKYVGNSPYNYGWGTTLKLGDDYIDAGEGNDQIFAGFGSDAIVGGPGIDMIFVGDQVVAPGYDPLFGPKVVYGDSRDTTNSPFPDIFVIGDIYSSEAQLKASTSGISDTSQLRTTMYEQVKGFEEGWKLAREVIGLIPGVGALLKGLGNAFFSYAKFHDSQSLPTKEGAKPLDALTVIKDFGNNDQLILKLEPGETVRFQKFDNYVANTNGYKNPLLGQVSGVGTMLLYGKGASEQYERVFLQGYTGSFQQIDSQPGNNGAQYVHFGGADFAGITAA